jgi:hypothetical protein
MLHNDSENAKRETEKPGNPYSFSFIKIDGLSALILGLALVVIPPALLYYSERSIAKINICKTMALKQVSVSTDSTFIGKTFNECLDEIEKR